ncbi:MAG: histidine ammonia-lyase [Acidobacteriota bacterium]
MPEPPPAACELSIDGNSLTLRGFEEVCRSGRKVTLAASARKGLHRSRDVVESHLSQGEAIYGITTGFGRLANVCIPAEQVEELQENLVRSHCAGVGPPLAEEAVRAVLLLRANCLAKGFSGVRLLLVERLLEFLNRGLHPVIPSKGSVGASGDLAPLAQVALALIGEGEMWVRGERRPCAEAHKAAGLNPLRLQAKEGLALVNGTQVSCGVGALSLIDSERLCTLADIASAMSVEALKGSEKPFDPRVQGVRPHPGQSDTAGNMKRLLADSEIMESHRQCGRVQDSYALRCIPQVHGAVRDVLSSCRRTLEIEVNSATDNPLVFPDEGDVISSGNFHGEPVAFALDFLAIALTDLGNISERRIDRMVNPDLSDLPAFLVPEHGLNSGLMMVQVTAAALASENKVLSHPASTDNIPTSGSKEDHVSMSTHAAFKSRQVVSNLEHILAIEILTACQALDFLKPLRPARAVQAVHAAVRRTISFMEQDRVVNHDIEAVRHLMLDGSLRVAAEEVCGALR